MTIVPGRSSVGYKSHSSEVMQLQLTDTYICINPLTTKDDYSRHQNSAARYQLVQSVSWTDGPDYRTLGNEWV